MDKKRNRNVVLVVFGGLIFALLLVIIGPAPEAATDTVTVSVTAQNISLFIKDKTVAYSNVALSGSKCSTTTSDTQYAVNNGNLAENFDILGDDTAAWNLTTSSIGANLYAHLFTTTTGSYWQDIDRAYVTLETGVTINATSTVDFYIFMPSSSSSYDPQSTDITIQASMQ